MADPPHLPNYQRIISGHNRHGEAVVLQDEPAPWDTNVEGGQAAFSLAYTTSRSPVNLNQDEDIRKYEDYLQKPPGLVERPGSVLRVVDMAPGSTTPMHRTVSLDYAIVLLGSVELLLDGGATKPMRAGDVCVQRATRHAWRNGSGTEWARVAFVLLPAEPVEVAGKVLVEDLGSITGVKKST